MRATAWISLALLIWSTTGLAATGGRSTTSLSPAQANIAPDYSNFPRELVSVDQAIRGSRPANERTDWVYLIVYRPNLSVDLSSPSRMYTSIHWGNLSSARDVKNGDVTIGHFETGWSCAARDGLPSMASATGHTGELYGGALEMLKNGGGMSPLIVDWMDGMLEEPNPGRGDPGMPNVSDRIRSNHSTIQVIAAAVRPEDCRRVGAFYNRFAETRAYRRFGLYANPARFEGGVCWSTSQASIEHIPALQSLFSSFHVSFNIPATLVGEASVKPRFMQYPREMQNQRFSYVSIDAFNNPDLSWNMRGPSFPYRTFDFQSFGAYSKREFAGCATPWCNLVRQRGGQLVTAQITSGLPVSTLIFDAR